MRAKVLRRHAAPSAVRPFALVRCRLKRIFRLAARVSRAPDRATRWNPNALLRSFLARVPHTSQASCAVCASIRAATHQRRRRSRGQAACAYASAKSIGGRIHATFRALRSTRIARHTVRSPGRGRLSPKTDPTHRSVRTRWRHRHHRAHPCQPDAGRPESDGGRRQPSRRGQHARTHACCNIDLYISTLASAVPFVKQERLRPLALTSTQRTKVLPDVPTMQEAGIEGYSYETWYGIQVPSATPKPIVEKLNRILVRAVESPTVRSQMEKIGIEPVTATPQQFAAHIRSEIDKWGGVVRTAGLAARR
ncbi:MAG: hypothetical protein GEV05_05700 [Betaproteobacteria bacterium]|nr:hypothetical protein [Betaproteobacteria bacterium]